MQTKSITLLFLLFSLPAFADYNTAAIDGPIVCQIKGVNGSVEMNANRSTFTVQISVTKFVYQVSDRNSDGDTYVQYAGGEVNSKWATVDYNDQGDSLTIGIGDMAHAYDLTCPQ